jgi:hypothetical protein
VEQVISIDCCWPKNDYDHIKATTYLSSTYRRRSIISIQYNIDITTHKHDSSERDAPVTMSSYNPQRGSWYSDDAISVSLSAGSAVSRSSSVRTTSGTTYKEIDFARLGRRRSRRGSRVIDIEIEGGAPLKIEHSTRTELGSSPPRTSGSPSKSSKKKEKKKGFFGTLIPTMKKTDKKNSIVDVYDISVVERRDSLEDRSPAGSGKGKERAHRYSFGPHPTAPSSVNSEEAQRVPYQTEIREPSWVSQAQDDKATALEAARLRYLHCRREAEAARDTPDEERLYNNYVAAKQAYARLEREYDVMSSNAPPSSAQRPRAPSAYHGTTSRTFTTRTEAPATETAPQNQRAPRFNAGGAADLNPLGRGTGSPSLHQHGFPPNYHPQQTWTYPAGQAYQTPIRSPSAPDAPPSTRRQDGRYTVNAGEIVREDLRPRPQQPETTTGSDSPRRQDGRYTVNAGEIVREDLRPSSATSPRSTSFATALESKRPSPSTATSPASSSRQNSPLEPIEESDEERVSRIVREQMARRRDEGEGRGTTYDA